MFVQVTLPPLRRPLPSVLMREEDVMKTGVFGALIALSVFFALFGGGAVAFSAELGHTKMVLAASETQIEPVHLSSESGALSISDGDLQASNRWLFEIVSVLVVGIMLQMVGWILRAHRKNQGAKTGELKEMLNGGVSV
jgi:hypothetical protein